MGVGFRVRLFFDRKPLISERRLQPCDATAAPKTQTLNPKPRILNPKPEAPLPLKAESEAVRLLEVSRVWSQGGLETQLFSPAAVTWVVLGLEG